ncbi:LysR family transcriptional regulator [Marinobacterium arenosum]|uniref:LysR family transcriptional regulator n=1 Tax=Marinobacterium arenosum TaxID=2862496 RepID=UPI001C968E25|nr:LysR family transcriptional regulator [Marinobacterium arenosum]MBY4678100.1 LysR family transcriptional regulator [Marinobacterium arenosum]
MDRLKAMQFFCKVAELGNFTSAAEQLHVSKGVVSRQISELESHLNTRLLNRSTRRVSLTEAGEQVYQQAQQLLDQFDQLESSLRYGQDTPHGLLKVSAPDTFGAADLVMLVEQFCEQYPHLKVELLLDNQHIDLVKESVDVALRFSVKLADSDLIARKLAEIDLAFYASPGYLAKHGEPTSIEQLSSDHQGFRFTPNRNTAQWNVIEQGETVSRPKRWTLATNNGHSLISAALRGMGVLQSPALAVQPYLENGELKRILPNCETPKLSVYAVYQSRRHTPAKVSRFVEFVQQYFNNYS